MEDMGAPFSENVPGRFYVCQTCLICNHCSLAAPANFRQVDEGTHSYVHKQAASELELQQMLQAVCDCPVLAIVDRDGPDADDSNRLDDL